MKTMKKGSEVRRVKEENVESRLREGFTYCAKSEYKGSENKTSDVVDDAIKKASETSVVEVHENPYKRKKR